MSVRRGMPSRSSATRWRGRHWCRARSWKTSRGSRAEGPGAIPLDVVHEIAGRFKVSEEVVLLRLLSAGRISREAYQQGHQDLQARPPPQRKSKGGPSVPVRVVSSPGVPYLRAVLDALHSDRITLSDVSDWLGVSVKHLPKIETLVLGAAAGAET